MNENKKTVAAHLICQGTKQSEAQFQSSLEYKAMNVKLIIQ